MESGMRSFVILTVIATVCVAGCSSGVSAPATTSDSGPTAVADAQVADSSSSADADASLSEMEWLTGIDELAVALFLSDKATPSVTRRLERNPTLFRAAKNIRFLKRYMCTGDTSPDNSTCQYSIDRIVDGVIDYGDNGWSLCRQYHCRQLEYALGYNLHCSELRDEESDYCMSVLSRFSKEKLLSLWSGMPHTP